MKLEDFRTKRPKDSMIQYYSFKCDNGDEICIEPLLDQSFYVARYDKNQLLIGEKLQTTKQFGFGVAEEAIVLANTLLWTNHSNYWSEVKSVTRSPVGCSVGSELRSWSPSCSSRHFLSVRFWSESPRWFSQSLSHYQLYWSPLRSYSGCCG